MCRYRLNFVFHHDSLFLFIILHALRTVIHVNAADIMHTAACYVQLQEIYRNAAPRSQRTSHTIQRTCKRNIRFFAIL